MLEGTNNTIFLLPFVYNCCFQIDENCSHLVLNVESIKVFLGEEGGCQGLEKMVLQQYIFDTIIKIRHDDRSVYMKLLREDDRC